MKRLSLCLALVLAVLVLLPAADACNNPNCPVYKKLCGEWRGEARDRKAKIADHRLLKVVLRFTTPGKVEGNIGGMVLTEGSIDRTRGGARRAFQRDFLITGKLVGNPKHGGQSMAVLIAFDIKNGLPEGEIMMGGEKGRDMVWRFMQMHRLDLKR